MDSLPLFPGWSEPAAPVSPAGEGTSGARRGRRGKAKGEASAAAAAVVEAMLMPEGSAPIAREVEVTVAVEVEVVAQTVELMVAPVMPARPRRCEAGVLVFDVETTGTDRRKDQVIELCMQRGLSGEDYKIWRFKPTVAIAPRAQEVHGISMEDLAGCPSFASCADEIRAMFAEASVIVGYNLAFDIDMLQAEYERAGRPLLDLSAKAVVDPYRLWQKCEPRKLQHAHQRFVGRGFEAAHSAAADVAATGRVLSGMVAAFGLDELDWDGLATVCDPERVNWIGPSRHVQWDGTTVVIGFGKHQGTPLHLVAAGENSGYLRWICDRDFPAHVGDICGRALELAGDAAALRGWVEQRFGAPPAIAPAGAADSASAPTPAPSAVAPPSTSTAMSLPAPLALAARA